MRRWLGSPWWLSIAFLLSLPAVTHRLNASDEIEYFAWLRSAVFDRDADFENEYQHFYELNGSRDPLFHETFLERVNENGRRHNFAPIGTALLWSPFFGVAHLVAGPLGFAVDGYSRPYIYAVTLASAVYGWLALLLSMAIVRRLTGGGASVWIVWLGTPLLFYMYVAPGFSHACSAFSVALMIWVWLRVRGQWTPAGAAQLGLAAGLLPMVREQDVFFLVGPAIDFLRWAVSGVRAGDARAPAAMSARVTRVLLSAAAGLAAFAIVYAPQIYAYIVLNGHPGPDATVGHKMRWTSPHLVSVLFSSEHGLFAWTPVALVAGLGLIFLASQKRSTKYEGSTRYEVRSTKYGRNVDAQAHTTQGEVRWLASLALVMFALQAYISGCVESWTVAGSFGQRRFVALTPVLAIGLAAFAAALRTRKYDVQSTNYEVRNEKDRLPVKGRTSYLALRASYGLVVFMSIWWNLGLMAQFGLHLMDRQRLTLSDNARVTFLELPLAAPSIAWRYLMDRESFYRQPRQ